MTDNLEHHCLVVNINSLGKVIKTFQNIDNYTTSCDMLTDIYIIKMFDHHQQFSVADLVGISTSSARLPGPECGEVEVVFHLEEESHSSKHRRQEHV